jgi:tartrate/fumarate subfamily iron-sulfur-dependent hydro-lyase beta chain
MKKIHLKIPLTEKDVFDLKLGDLVYLDGPVFTVRSLFHLRAIREDILPPLDFKRLNVMVHIGPVMKKDGGHWSPVSLDPTTSMRFEKYTAEVVSKLGLRAIIGKGGMGSKTMEAMKKYGCVHLAKIGIYGNILASKVTRVLGVYGLEEMGPIECTWVFEAKDFGPFLVDIDARGESFFEDIKHTTQEKLLSVYQRFSIS